MNFQGLLEIYLKIGKIFSQQHLVRSFSYNVQQKFEYLSTNKNFMGKIFLNRGFSMEKLQVREVSIFPQKIK